MHSHPHFYYVYIMTNRSKTIYTGVTGYLEKRVFEHKQGIKGEFARRYNIDRLVYFERFGEVHAAIAQQIKGLLRIKKIALIVSMNPDWKSPSPPPGWAGDSHPQAVEHVRHTNKQGRLTPPLFDQ
jgi:putative endonuclease